jgi:hypothetical protein
MNYFEKIPHARQMRPFAPVSLFKASYPNSRNTRTSGSVIQRGFLGCPRYAVKGHGFGLANLQPKTNKMLSTSLIGETSSLQRVDPALVFETQFLLSQLDYELMIKLFGMALSNQFSLLIFVVYDEGIASRPGTYESPTGFANF